MTKQAEKVVFLLSECTNLIMRNVPVKQNCMDFSKYLKNIVHSKDW